MTRLERLRAQFRTFAADPDRRLALAVGAFAAGAFFAAFERPWTLRGDNELGILPMAAEAFRQ